MTAVEAVSLLEPPREVERNVEYRRRLIRRCEKDVEFRRAVFARCANGVDGFWFWMDSFVWQTNPLLGDDCDAPFIAWDIQREVFSEVWRHVKEAKESCAIEKSRAMGASWLMLMVFLWFWLFTTNGSFTVGSESEEKVDGPDMDALLPKIDYVLDRLPLWMKPAEFGVWSNKGKNKFRTFKTLRHPHFPNNSIRGSATKDDMARGGRRRAIGLDEHAAMKRAREIHSAVAGATNCIISVSTPKGEGTYQAEWIRSGGIKVYRMHWTDVDQYTEGLYACNIGCKFHPEGGRPHSPWYDAQCAKIGDPQIVAQELDIDYARAGGAVFNTTNVNKAIEFLLDKKPDLRCYKLDWIPRGEIENPTDKDARYRAMRAWSVNALPVDSSAFRVYAEPVAGHQYVIGADVSKGLPHGDYHALYVMDVTEGLIVAEWHGKCPPSDVAEEWAKICYWYGPMSKCRKPYAAVEWNDQGGTVNEILCKINCCHLYRTRSKDLSRRIADKLGVVVPTVGKMRYISDTLVPVIEELGEDGLPVLVCPFLGFWRECTWFVAMPTKNGELTPERARCGGQGKQPDDRVMAMAHTIEGAIMRHGRWRGVPVKAPDPTVDARPKDGKTAPVG